MVIRKSFRVVFFLTFPLVAKAAFSQGAFETKPDIHGDNVVFTAEGDLWLGSISGHAAKRITSDPGTETNARFSPDGRQIAFTGQYDGGSDVYLMPTEGGAPKRLTYDPSGADVQGWTPDGADVLFRSRRYSPVGGVRHLFLVSEKGGPCKELPIPRAEFGSIDGRGVVAYVPTSFEWANWFHYQGGWADQIWISDTRHTTFKRLTETKTVETTPVWCLGKVYFVSWRGGWSNLWSIDPDTKAAKQCTFYTDRAIRYPSSDGHRVIFQLGAGLGVYDPSSGKSEDLSFQLASDRIHAREQRTRVIGEIDGDDAISLGPTGKRILLETRGQIISVASEAGDMRVLEKKDATRARFPIWSSDGKRFAFITDRSGENEIWIGDSAGGGQPKQLTNGLHANTFKPVWSPDDKWIAMQDRNGRVVLVDAASGAVKVLDTTENLSSYDDMPGTVAFSPDGKYLAYSKHEPNWNSAIYLYEISDGKSERITDPRLNCMLPAFDTTGKFLLYAVEDAFQALNSGITGKYFFMNTVKVNMLALSNEDKSPFLPKDDEEGVAADQKQKTEIKAQQTPSGTKVDWDGMTDRVIEVPLAPRAYSHLESLPGKVLALDRGTLYSYDLNTRKEATIASGISDFQKSADGKKLLLAQGQAISVHDATTGPTEMSQGAVDLSPYSIAYNPVPEWREAFEESWRIARDFYYDPGMHGLDWNAVRRKYEARLNLVGDRADLSRLLIDMVSELGTGHAYISGPRVPPVHPDNMGFLGIDTEPVSGADAVRIKKIYRGDAWSPSIGSPLAAPGTGVKKGDYILEVAGEPVKGDIDIQSLLVGTRGETVALMVNDKPTRDGAKVVRVRPLVSESDLRYQEWVEGRKKYVLEHGGPNFGYVHIPNMGNGGLNEFAKGQFVDQYKTAMIYDERYNGGGYTSSLILQDIQSLPLAWFKPRVGLPWTREGWANIGHKAMLCNEYNFSDGELFVEDWKKLKLGPVVGMRTGGGEVGSGGGYSLVDHGLIYVPNYGAYADGEWIVEGHGATPTVEVEQDPAEEMSGKDPQLDRAIAILKQELQKDPISIPLHPPFKK